VTDELNARLSSLNNTKSKDTKPKKDESNDTKSKKDESKDAEPAGDPKGGGTRPADETNPPKPKVAPATNSDAPGPDALGPDALGKVAEVVANVFQTQHDKAEEKREAEESKERWAQRKWRVGSSLVCLVLLAALFSSFSYMGRNGAPRHPRKGSPKPSPTSSTPRAETGWRSWWPGSTNAVSGTQPKCTAFHVWNDRARFEETRLIFKGKQAALACYSRPGHFACMVSGLGSNTTVVESEDLEGAMWTLVSWPPANGSFNKDAFLEGFDRRPFEPSLREDRLLSKPDTKLATVETIWPLMFNISRRWNHQAAGWKVRFICKRRFECLSCKMPFVLTQDSVWDGATSSVQYTDQFCVGHTCTARGEPIKASNRTTLSTHQLHEGQDAWPLMCLKRGAEVLGSGEACTSTECSWAFSLRQLMVKTP
jgi:hypothetical protein